MLARPREFDEDEVLDKAMHLFWARGYDATSTADLLAVMGITNSSLYKAFGSKEGLFVRAAERYRAGPLAFRAEAFNETTPRRLVERLLLGTVELLTGEHTPPGCLDVNSGIGGTSGIRALFVENRGKLRELIRDRLTQLGSANSFPPGADAASAAALVATLAHGLAVQAADGATREELRMIVRTFLAPWPEERRAQFRPHSNKKADEL